MWKSSSPWREAERLKAVQWTILRIDDYAFPRLWEDLVSAKIWGVILLCAVSGCQSEGKAKTTAWLQSQGMDQGSATLLASNKPALRQYLMNKSMAPQDDAYCRSLGAKVGSDAYVQCRTSVSANRPVNDPPPRPGPVTCTSNVVLGALRTTCN